MHGLGRVNYWLWTIIFTYKLELQQNINYLPIVLSEQSTQSPVSVSHTLLFPWHSHLLHDPSFWRVKPSVHFVHEGPSYSGGQKHCSIPNTISEPLLKAESNVTFDSTVVNAFTSWVARICNASTFESTPNKSSRSAGVPSSNAQSV